MGPQDSAYDGGYFYLSVEWGADYPLSAPIMRFLTPVFCAHVSEQDGRIHMSILDGEWTPAAQLESLLVSVRSLLCDPPGDVCARPEVRDMYRNQRDVYEQFARQARWNAVELPADHEFFAGLSHVAYWQHNW
jgi:ubiquitin-protein ligase